MMLDLKCSARFVYCKYICNVVCLVSGEYSSQIQKSNTVLVGKWNFTSFSSLLFSSELFKESSLSLM